MVYVKDILWVHPNPDDKLCSIYLGYWKNVKNGYKYFRLMWWMHDRGDRVLHIAVWPLCRPVTTLTWKDIKYWLWK